jgi:5-methylcytosine-specific restriction endonuclease McrA
MNRWDLPDWLEREVIERDRRCVYCGVDFTSSNETRKSKPTWEHIVNNEKIINRENIARCCFSCNASKGAKDLSVWLESNYCKKRGSTKDTVAEVVRKAIAYPPQVGDFGT